MAQTMAQYVAEQAREQGRQEGRQEGIEIGQARGIEIGQASGIEIGKARASRHALLTLLTVRFGELPPAVTQVIETAQTEQLEKWLTIAVMAVSLEEIGIETQH